MRPSVKPVRVLIVDDHEVVRVGLRTVLSREDGITVVGEVATATDAVFGVDMARHADTAFSGNAVDTFGTPAFPHGFAVPWGRGGGG